MNRFFASALLVSIVSFFFIFFWSKKPTILARTVVALMGGAVVGALFAFVFWIAVWVVGPKREVIKEVAPLILVNDGAHVVSAIYTDALREEREGKVYVVFSVTQGALSSVVFSEAKVKLFEENRRDAVIEKCDYEYLGWAADFGTPKGTGFYRLRIPKGTLGKQIQSKEFFREE